MDGNRPTATAQRMPSGKEQDWGDQPLFDQSDLDVIPAAWICEIFTVVMEFFLPQLAPMSWRIVFQ